MLDKLFLKNYHHSLSVHIFRLLLVLFNQYSKRYSVYTQMMKKQSNVRYWRYCVLVFQFKNDLNKVLSHGVIKISIC